MWSYLHDLLRDMNSDEDGSGQKQMPPEMSLFNDVTISQLLQPDMTAHAVQVGLQLITTVCTLAHVPIFPLCRTAGK